MTSSLRREIEANQAREQLDRAKRETDSLRARLSSVTKERDRLAQQISLIESLDVARVKHPEWALPSKKKGLDRRATLCLLVTDTHFDEIVDPAQIRGVNCFNREIAELRLRRCVEKTVLLARTYLSGVQYDGLALFLGGDIFSGIIHEELQRTNESTLFDSILHWLGPMSTTLGMLTDEFKKLHVVAVPGNHGRQTRKPIAKNRASDNADWLLYRLLQRDLRSDARISWEIPNSSDAYLTLYKTRFLLTHGDQFKGGSGISGALAPLMLGHHRKTQREIAIKQLLEAIGTGEQSGEEYEPYDYMVLGHWHQELALTDLGLIVGPCLKGYDEYAWVSNFRPRPAAQAVWVTTPEHGITFNSRVYVTDRAAEGW